LLDLVLKLGDRPLEDLAVINSKVNAIVSSVTLPKRTLSCGRGCRPRGDLFGECY
jgi:hypothetical protein